MAGIDSLVNSRADMFAANPQGLQQRYAMGQDLLDLLALQKLKKDKEAAQRSLQMQMQPESGTVKDQLEGQMMQATKQELASSLAPGLQQQGQAMQAQQMQKAMAGGLPTQPAPNMVNMARGGIVGYAPGGDVQKEKDFIQTFTTPSGERLTRDDLIMMRRADQIPQETMLIDSSGQRLTVSDAIMNPMSRSDEIDMTPEGAARRRAYERIGTERSRPLEESPEEMLARTMGIPGDRDVRSVRTMPRASGVDAGGLGGGVLGPALARLFGGNDGETQEGPSRPGRLIEALGGAPSAGGGTGRVTYMGTGDRDVRSVRTMPEPTKREQESGWRTASRMQGEGAEARYKPGQYDEKRYVEMMQNPPRPSVLDPEDYVRLMQNGTPSTTEAPAQATQSTTPAAGIESLVAPRSAPSSGAGVRAPADRRSAEEAAMQATRYQATDEDLRSMMGEDVAPMQRAAPTAPTDPRMSRYEDQLARLEAEEKDKLGSLIDFLLAAGASGGTNLGATLMGGGSGLQAREQRIKAEMAQTVKNIEDLQFQRDEMQARREETAADRELRDLLARREDATRRSEGAADRGSRENVAQLNRNADIAMREAANASALTQEQQANLRALYNAYRELATDAREAANELGRGDSEKAKSLLEYEGFMERLRALEGLIDIPVAGGAAIVGGDGWGIER